MIVGKKPWRVRRLLLDFLIRRLNDSSGGQIRDVQVGANDGVLDDPVYAAASEFGWTGLLVEPVPIYFSRLQKLYADNPKMIMENVGVSDTAGMLKIYYLAEHAEQRFPEWVRGCASTDRQRLVAAMDKFGAFDETDLASCEVPVCRLDQLLVQFGISEIDLLVIDVEGHELHVLDGADFDRIRPRMVVIEANSDEASRRKIAHYLEEKDYLVGRIGDDLVGFSSAYPKIDLSELLRLTGFHGL